MPHITTCTKCGCAYEEASEEAANAPAWLPNNRLCSDCRRHYWSPLRDNIADVEPASCIELEPGEEVRIITPAHPLSSMDYVVFDFETTALPGANGWDDVHLAQIGYLCRLHGAWLSPAERLVKLPDGVEIAPEAAAVNRLSAELCNTYGRDLADALTPLVLAIDVSKVVVGHNIMKFDWPLLQHALSSRLGRDPLAEVTIYDTRALWLAHVFGLRRGPGETWESFQRWALAHADHNRAEQIYDKRVRSSLAFLSRLFAVEIAPNHTALGDCRATLGVWQALLDRGIVQELMEERA